VLPFRLLFQTKKPYLWLSVQASLDLPVPLKAQPSLWKISRVKNGSAFLKKGHEEKNVFKKFQKADLSFVWSCRTAS
jgi:hypothetical protein